MYTLDTNAVIYYIGNDPDATPVIRELVGKSPIIYMATVSEIELFAFPTLSESDTLKIREMLSSIFLVALDSKIAEIAAEIKKQTSIKIPDLIVAATAIYTKTTLVTRNIRDFNKIPNLPILKI